MPSSDPRPGALDALERRETAFARICAAFSGSRCRPSEGGLARAQRAQVSGGVHPSGPAMTPPSTSRAVPVQ